MIDSDRLVLKLKLTLLTADGARCRGFRIGRPKVIHRSVQGASTVLPNGRIKIGNCSGMHTSMGLEVDIRGRRFLVRIEN